MNKWAAVALVFSGLVMIAPCSVQGASTGQISGHVVDSEGATIPRASVFVVRKNGPPKDNLRLVALTDIHGDFMLILPEGGYDILVTSPAFVAEVETIAVVSGKTRKTQWKLKFVGCDFPGMNCDTFQY